MGIVLFSLLSSQATAGRKYPPGSTGTDRVAILALEREVRWSYYARRFGGPLSHSVGDTLLRSMNAPSQPVRQRSGELLLRWIDQFGPDWDYLLHINEAAFALQRAYPNEPHAKRVGWLAAARAIADEAERLAFIESTLDAEPFPKVIVPEALQQLSDMNSPRAAVVLGMLVAACSDVNVLQADAVVHQRIHELLQQLRAKGADRLAIVDEVINSDVGIRELLPRKIHPRHLEFKVRVAVLEELGRDPSPADLRYLADFREDADRDYALRREAQWILLDNDVDIALEDILQPNYYH